MGEFRALIVLYCLSLFQILMLSLKIQLYEPTLSVGVQIVLSELLSSLLLCIVIVLHFMVRELYLYLIAFCIIMDQLDADQLEQLKKCSSERLRLKLMRVGEEDDVIRMDRPKLLEAVAKLMLLNVDDGQVNTDMHKPTDIRLRRELELEERRLRLEESKTQAKLEESKTQAELKKEEMKMKMQLEMKIRKMEIDREFRLTELRAQGLEVTGAVLGTALSPQCHG